MPGRNTINLLGAHTEARAPAFQSPRALLTPQPLDSQSPCTAAMQAVAGPRLAQCSGAGLAPARRRTLPLPAAQRRHPDNTGVGRAAASRSLHPQRRQVQAARRPTAAASAAAADAAAAASADEDPSTAFDWQLGLALAGCAFEAYNAVEPEEGSPFLKMTSGGGTEVTFVSE